MSEFKIDEKLINEVSNGLSRMMEYLQQTKEELLNVNLSVFDRYTSFARGKCLIRNLGNAVESHRESMAFGFDINHSFFNGKEKEEHGWGDIKLENNPFLISKEYEEIRETKKKLDASFKDLLIEISKINS